MRKLKVGDKVKFVKDGGYSFCNFKSATGVIMNIEFGAPVYYCIEVNDVGFSPAITYRFESEELQLIDSDMERCAVDPFYSSVHMQAEEFFRTHADPDGKMSEETFIKFIIENNFKREGIENV